MGLVAPQAVNWPQLWWPAPAKLNLMLRIIGQRADGYHFLQTVFQLVDFNDQLNFVPRKDTRICMSEGIAEVAEKDNLIIKAATLLQQKNNVNQGVTVSLKKILPMGAGMGGGSSDAATTLLVLNYMWGLGCSNQELMNLGLELGADVPVFIAGKSAWAEGVGEKITPLSLAERWFLIVSPATHNATKEIFTHYRLTRDSSAITIRAFLDGQIQNDCLSVVREINKEFDLMYRQFSEFSDVYLTGTGSSMFAKCNSRKDAEALLEKLPRTWKVAVVKGVNDSPLHTLLNKFMNQV